MSLVTINHAEVNEIISRGQRVVTIDMVSGVHGLPYNTVYSAYHRNSRHFQDGVHTWVLEGEELQCLRSSLLNQMTAPSVRVFTELGYYLLVKPLKDDTSWDIQTEMANAYFKVSRIIQPQLPPPLTVIEQIEAIKSVYEFMLDIGLSDDYTRIMAKESLHNHLRALGNVGGQQQPLLPQTTETQAYFQIEDLRASLPKVSDKEWFNLRGTFGKVARLAIQAADPECQPHRIEKNVNGANRMVNMWPNDYRDIAIAAIKRHMERIANDDSERLV